MINVVMCSRYYVVCILQYAWCSGKFTVGTWAEKYAIYYISTLNIAVPSLSQAMMNSLKKKPDLKVLFLYLAGIYIGA